MSDEQDIDAELELPEKWRRFVDAYMGDANGNGVKAARLAGYVGCDTRLAVQASRLIRNDKVRKAMDARLENDPLVAGRVERTRFLTSVMRGEVLEPKVVGKDEDGTAIVEDCEPSLRDRLAAQEALSKLSGEQVTKVAQTNAAGEDVKGLTLEQLFGMAALTKDGG